MSYQLACGSAKTSGERLREMKHPCEMAGVEIAAGWVVTVIVSVLVRAVAEKESVRFQTG